MPWVGALKGNRVPSDRRNSVVEGKSRLNRHALSPPVSAGRRLPPPLKWQRLHRAFHRVARFDETTEDVRRSFSQSCSDARSEWSEFSERVERARDVWRDDVLFTLFSRSRNNIRTTIFEYSSIIV